jgi:hypothetical protein
VRTLLTILLSLSLVSCVTINVTTGDINESKQPVKVKACDDYKIVDFGIAPITPIKELEDTSIKDYKSKVLILIDYIKSLKEYINKIKQDTEDKYNKYKESCK